MNAACGYLMRAIELARRGVGGTSPNPPVGAVLVRRGEIVGEGWHKRAGGDHAEVAAIKNARRRGFRDFGDSILYVSLEPCSRAGRVGACTDAISAAGIGKVVYATMDPNPANRGRARRTLARRGVDCRLYAGEGCRGIRLAAQDLVRHFAKLATTGLPYVTVKIAMSLDGRICDVNGDAKWVSSEKARRATGALRETVDAVMVGADTVRRDDPSLLSHAKPNPRLSRVVVSRSGRLPRDARIFTDGEKNKTLVFRDPLQALRALGAAGAMHVLCEGGLKLASSMAAAGLVDEWIAVLAPKVIGNAPIGEAVRIGRVSCLQDW